MLATYSVIAYSYIHHSVLWFMAIDETISMMTLAMLNSSTRKNALPCRSRLRARSGLSLMNMMRKNCQCKIAGLYVPHKRFLPFLPFLSRSAPSLRLRQFLHIIPAVSILS